jgi:hypothetical protein
MWPITEIVSPTQVKIVRLTAAQTTGSSGGVQYHLASPDLFTPERYKAWIRYGMWLTKPRVVREFRGDDNQEQYGMDYLYGLIAAVDEVYTNPLLKQFWRLGEPVKNPAWKHPYKTAEPAEYQTDAARYRWYNLTTDADTLPPDSQSVALTLEIKVWALALKIGTAPNREWLVYAYSPKKDRSNVTITIPEYGNITIDVPQAGVFHHVREE